MTKSRILYPLAMGLFLTVRPLSIHAANPGRISNLGVKGSGPQTFQDWNTFATKLVEKVDLTVPKGHQTTATDLIPLSELSRVAFQASQIFAAAAPNSPVSASWDDEGFHLRATTQHNKELSGTILLGTHGERDESQISELKAHLTSVSNNPEQIVSVLNKFFEASSRKTTQSETTGVSFGSEQVGGAPTPREKTVTLGHFTVNGAMEAITTPGSKYYRNQLVEALSNSEHNLKNRMGFLHQVAQALLEHLSAEGISKNAVQSAKTFFEAITRMFIDQGMTDPAIGEVEGLIVRFGQMTSQEIKVLSQLRKLEPPAIEAKEKSENESLFLAVYRATPNLVIGDNLARFMAAISRLRKSHIIPTGRLIVSLMNSADENSTQSHFLSLRKQLETREPEVFDDLEAAIFFSILSERMDMSEVSLGVYLDRVSKFKESLQQFGYKSSPWIRTDAEGRRHQVASAFTPTQVDYEYTPIDVSKVDREVIQELREQVRDSHDAVLNMSLIDKSKLPPEVKNEIIEKVWAYLSLLDLKISSPHEVEGEKIWHIQGKKISQHLNKKKQLKEGPFANSDPMAAIKKEILKLTESLKDPATAEPFEDSFGVFVALDIVLNQIFTHNAYKHHRPIVKDLMASNMLGYEWLDSVARTELKASSDSVESWDSAAIYDALDRLRLIYTKKTGAFAAKVGINPPSELKGKLSSLNKMVLEQLGKIGHSRIGTGTPQILKIVPITGITAMMRGYYGHDCSKSMDKCRGSLAQRAVEPWSVYYGGMVEGKYVGYGQFTVASSKPVHDNKNFNQVLLADLIQFKAREALYPQILVAINKTKDPHFTGIAVASQLHPKDPHTGYAIAHFTNFYEGVSEIQNWKPYQRGSEFSPQFSPSQKDSMTRFDDQFGSDPYVYWALSNQGFKDASTDEPIRGTYVLLDFSEFGQP